MSEQKGWVLINYVQIAARVVGAKIIGVASVQLDAEFN